MDTDTRNYKINILQQQLARTDPTYRKLDTMAQHARGIVVKIEMFQNAVEGTRNFSKTSNHFPGAYEALHSSGRVRQFQSMIENYNAYLAQKKYGEIECDTKLNLDFVQLPNVLRVRTRGKILQVSFVDSARYTQFSPRMWLEAYASKAQRLHNLAERNSNLAAINKHRYFKARLEERLGTLEHEN